MNLLKEVCNIYFIQAENGGPVKIGKASNVHARIKGLQTSFPYKLRLIGLIKDTPRHLENHLHRHFHHLRMEGEWFSDKILESLDEIQKAVDDYWIDSMNRVLSNCVPYEIKIEWYFDGDLGAGMTIDKYWKTIDNLRNKVSALEHHISNLEYQLQHGELKIA